MLRIIDQFVPKRSFFMLCDQGGCLRNISAPIAEGADLELQANIFVQTAAGKGWNVTIMGHLCDGHNRANRDRKLVELVSNSALVTKQ